MFTLAENKIKKKNQSHLAFAAHLKENFKPRDTSTLQQCYLGKFPESISVYSLDTFRSFAPYPPLEQQW